MTRIGKVNAIVFGRARIRVSKSHAEMRVVEQAAGEGVAHFVGARVAVNVAPRTYHIRYDARGAKHHSRNLGALRDAVRETCAKLSF